MLRSWFAPAELFLAFCALVFFLLPSVIGTVLAVGPVPIKVKVVFLFISLLSLL